jgi:ABC-2 type transport system ATP-binding protein
MTYTVITSNLRKAYGDLVVLDGIDLAVEAGMVFALLGPNGAGKTTLVNILSTLVRPDGGEARVAGHDLRTDAENVRRSISLTGQYAAVDEVLTGEENLVMIGRLLGLGIRSARKRADSLLDEFDLVDARKRRVSTYSGGMRRRLDLALSLIARPPLVFLDEPTTGLDPLSRERMWSAVGDLVDVGTTVFLTTQYLEEADRLADRIAMLTGGRIVVEGTAAALKASLSEEIAAFEFADDLAYAGAAAALRDVPATHHPDRRTIEVATDGTAARVGELLARLDASGAAAARLALHQPSLDDVFFSLTCSTPNGARP